MRKALEIFNESQHELNAMLMAIVGRERFPDGLFVGAVTALDIVSCKPMDSSLQIGMIDINVNGRQ